MTNSARLHTFRSYESSAKETLSPSLFDYIAGAAEDELTKASNRRAFDSIRLRPLCLRNVSCVDSAVRVFGRELHAPILVAPTAFHALIDPDGEIATATAANHCRLPMIVSSMSSCSLESIAERSGHPNLWFQCYLFKDRALTEALIQRAEASAYKAIVLTVGIPISGKRHRDLRNQFRLPESCATGNFDSALAGRTLSQFTADSLDPSASWKDVEWLRNITKLPLLLKGILNAQDAERACSVDVSGLIVSNHGGRQVDTSEATISVLPEIVQAVDGEMPVLIDGGVSKGVDVLKSLALGADAVLIGRPVLWALAVGGSAGVESLLNLLSDDFRAAMQLTGCRTAEEIRELGSSICRTSSPL